MAKHKRNSSLFQYLADTVTFGIPDQASRVPVLVNERNDGISNQDSEVIDDIPLLSVEEFSFYSILKAVEPEVEEFLKAYNDVMDLYRGNINEEVNSAALMQSQITDQMARIDKLAMKTLHNSHNRISKSRSALKELQGVEDLARTTEFAYQSIANIVNVLYEIEAVLPANDRLALPNSVHQGHYPNLFKLLKNSSSVRVQGVGPRKSLSMSSLISEGSRNLTDVSTSSKSRSSHYKILGDSDSISNKEDNPPLPDDRDQGYDQRILLNSRIPEGYPRALLSYKTLSPQVSSPRRYSVSSDTLPMSESESASTVTSISRSFSLHNIVSMWPRPASSKSETAQQRLRRIMTQDQ